MATSAKASSTSLTCLTWNIEGIRRNCFVLAEILNTRDLSFAFLTEIQAYQNDLQNVLDYVQEKYCFAATSDDIMDPDLPLLRSKAKGGAMILWKQWLDPYIKVIPPTSSSYLAIVLRLPGRQTSVHVSLYLPTHGQDTEFVSELAGLKICLDKLNSEYDYPIIFIRGDANVNDKNTTRVNMLNSFMDHLNLTKTPIEHRTYHHFVGDGKFDSNVDVILHSIRSRGVAITECITSIICKKTCPALNSHHDAIQSLFQLPIGDQEQGDIVSHAPRINHQQYKVTWSEEGIEKYSSLVGLHLERLRDSWLRPNCQASMSVLLELTNIVMVKCAAITNKQRVVKKGVKKPKFKLPVDILKAKRKMNKAHKRFATYPCSSTEEKFRTCRKHYHQTVRAHNVKTEVERDAKLYSVMGENPSKVFRTIRFLKNSQANNIAKLTVGDQTYHGKHVADGFYHSMSALKECDIETLYSEPALAEKLQDYEIVISLCQHHQGIPPLDLDVSTKLLKSLRRDVRDHYSITSQHYLNAGDQGHKHFNKLINGIISDLSNAGLEELNTAHGIILFKGHGKEKTSDRSYRTISTCPLLAKATDMYIRSLYGGLWQKQEAATQYQGIGSSHELASLLLTEVIQYSLFVSKEPLYLLALDAQSAFDRCLRQVLVSELYKASIPPSAIYLIDKRLSSRHTVYEWEGESMGPAKDITGFEQGGVNSSDYYKMYNNEQLKSAQGSKLGVNIGSGVVSAIGQADDVILAAPSLYNLQLLVKLTELYCDKYRVKLEPSKTKLVAYYPPNQRFLVEHALNSHKITVNKCQIKQVTEVEHVGVLRNTAGNLSQILNRVAMHKKSLHALLPTGLARRHRGNPAVSIKLSLLYGAPVLLSGVASLVLTQKELSILDGHYLRSIQGLLRLHERTPRSVVYFLAGTLPVRALLHQRILSLFSMVCHLQGDPLNEHARHSLLLSTLCPKSWFQQVKNICALYGLPHPLQLLENPPKKELFKRLVKKSIVRYWQDLLAAEAQQLPSLSYFNPRVHSLTHPHPLWLAAGSSSYKVNKATILARMISGRYRTERLCRFWSDNPGGYCLASTCTKVDGDLVHLLLHCPALIIARKNLLDMWVQRAVRYPALYSLVLQVLQGTDTLKMLFILDPTAIPAVDHLVIEYGMEVLDLIYHMSMSYAYGLHRKKLIITGRWPYATNNENCQQFNKIQINSVSVAGGTERPGVDLVPLPESSSCGGTASMSDENTNLEPATLATAEPEQGGLPRCTGHASALDHLGGVEDGTCVDRSILGYSGNLPTCHSTNTSLVPSNFPHSGDTPLLSCGAALPMIGQFLDSSPDIGTL